MIFIDWDRDGCIYSVWLLFSGLHPGIYPPQCLQLLLPPLLPPAPGFPAAPELQISCPTARSSGQRELWRLRSKLQPGS